MHQPYLRRYPKQAEKNKQGLMSTSTASNSKYSYIILSAFMQGFFVMSAGPVGFQYAAEVSHPAPESTSQGSLLWVGQLSGMLFVAGMSIRNKQYLGNFMVLFILLAFLALAGVLLLRESKFMKISASQNKPV